MRRARSWADWALTPRTMRCSLTALPSDCIREVRHGRSTAGRNTPRQGPGHRPRPLAGLVRVAVGLRSRRRLRRGRARDGLGDEPPERWAWDRPTARPAAVP